MAAAPATSAPITIGTRGTVGSLIKKEIEYFSRVELGNHRRSEQRPEAQSVEMDPSSGHPKSRNSRPSFWFFSLSLRKKKQRYGRGFRSSVCAAPNSADVNRLSSVRGFNYVILGDEFSHASPESC